MAKFNLTWESDSVLANTNATAQRASYRAKTAGGSWITTGFSLSNDLAKSVESIDSPTITDNLLYEFKIEAICTLNGPIMNDNGVQDGLNFACLAPVITKDHDVVQAVLTVTGLDITKAKFTLKKTSDNTTVNIQTINRSGTTITYNHTGLNGATSYYFMIELYATINSMDVVSSGSSYLGSPCGAYPFTTDAEPTCDPVTSLTATSEQVI